PNPALQTRMSMRPSRRSTSPTAARTWLSSVMSAPMWFTPSCGRSWRENSYTRQPAAANRAAVQRPIPPLPPVTMATSTICEHLRYYVHRLVQQLLRVRGHIARAQQAVARRDGGRQHGVDIHAALIELLRLQQRVVRALGADGDYRRGGGLHRHAAKRKALARVVRERHQPLRKLRVGLELPE